MLPKDPFQASNASPLRSEADSDALAVEGAFGVRPGQYVEHKRCPGPHLILCLLLEASIGCMEEVEEANAKHPGSDVPRVLFTDGSCCDLALKLEVDFNAARGE